MEKVAVYVFIKDVTLNGGGERIVVNYANELARLYPVVNIVSYYKTNPDIRYPIDPQVGVIYLAPGKRRVPTPPLWAKYPFHIWNFGRQLGPKLRRLIKETTPAGYKSVVLFVGYETPRTKPEDTYYVGIDGSDAITTSGRTFAGRVYNAVLRRLHRKLDVAGVLSDRQLEQWAHLGKPVRILTNFMSGIPNEVPPQRGREKTIVAAGRMDCDMKGFDRLIEAYSAVASRHPEWTLKIFGEGPLKVEYQGIIDRCGSGKYIKLMPFSRNIFEEYKRASIFAMSSRYEPFGLVTIEAMACGAAAVGIEGSVPSGTAFIMERNLGDCLAARGDMEDFISKLERLMNDEELREEVARRGRQEVLERFSPEAQMRVWRELIGEWTSR